MQVKADEIDNFFDADEYLKHRDARIGGLNNRMASIERRISALHGLWRNMARELGNAEESIKTLQQKALRPEDRPEPPEYDLAERLPRNSPASKPGPAGPRMARILKLSKRAVRCSKRNSAHCGPGLM